ncbi:MAG: hypothetical protein ACQESF_00595 [Nanobdellota archaeon]
MNIIVMGRNKDKVGQLQKQINNYGNDSKKKPDLVISLGGDGTLLRSERIYPGIPKLPVRKKEELLNISGVSKFNEVFRLLNEKRFTIKKYNKIRASIGQNELLAANEISIKNKTIYSALRFSAKINKIYHKEIIGDGVVISTTFGSTGYFYSITKQSFCKGYGVAFNNTTKDLKPIFLDNPKITIKIIRNNALVSADNYPGVIELKEGESIDIKGSLENMSLVNFFRQ